MLYNIKGRKPLTNEIQRCSKTSKSFENNMVMMKNASDPHLLFFPQCFRLFHNLNQVTFELLSANAYNIHNSFFCFVFHFRFIKSLVSRLLHKKGIPLPDAKKKDTLDEIENI